MKSTKFKRGDKVRLVSWGESDAASGRWLGFSLNKVYTLGGKYFDDNNPEFMVEKDDAGIPNGHSMYIFELVQPAEIFYEIY